MNSVHLGLIGLGWWGGVLADSARKSGRAEVVTCFSRSPDTRAAFTKAHGGRSVESVDALLKDTEIEGVLIATPHTTHGGFIEQAASAGKHVFVEKPLTLSVEEGRKAARAADKAGVVLQVGQSRRRQPANRKIKAMIDAGELGTVLQLEGNQSSPAGHNPNLSQWRRDPRESPAGGMTGMGVHQIDNFNYFVGPARKLFAFSKHIATPLKLDDATAFVIEYESGPLGYIGTSFFAPQITDTTVYGQDAAVWNTEDGKKLYLQRRADPERTEHSVESIDIVADELAEFADCIQGGRKPETGAREGLEVVALLEAVIESSRSGRAVDIADFR